MTREEVENCIVNTLFECTHSGEDDTISDKEFAEVLADKFINHEIDLLKEFVEWYKEVLEQDYDDKVEMMSRNGEEVAANFYFYQGQCDAIHRLIILLDRDIKQFLKERK